MVHMNLEFEKGFYVIMLSDDCGILLSDKPETIKEFIYTVQEEDMNIDDVKVYYISHGTGKQKIFKILNKFATAVEGEGFLIEDKTLDIKNESFETLVKGKKVPKKRLARKPSPTRKDLEDDEEVKPEK